MIRSFFQTVLLVAILGVLSGCPRGETNTLDEVLQASKDEFGSVKDVSVTPEVKQKLDRLVALLDSLPSNVSTPDLGKTANEVADILSELTPKASVTNRPAMAELVPQFRAYGESGATSTVAQAKLLSSRTYSLLASELETLHFQFS